MNLEKCNKFEILKLYAYVFKLNLKKQNRTISTVNQEYDLGLWNKNVEDSDFTSLKGNYGKTGQSGIFVVNDELVKMSYREFIKNKEIEQLSFFQDFQEDEIVELGCGLGGNLFSLYNNGFKNLTGCDLSPNAISKLKNYVEKNNIKINFFVHDLNRSFETDLIKDKVVFSHTVLEQCKNIMQNVLKNILKGMPKLVINFEVNYNKEPLLVRKYFDSRDYQNNLIDELKKLENDGEISIVKIQKLKFSGVQLTDYL